MVWGERLTSKGHKETFWEMSYDVSIVLSFICQDSFEDILKGVYFIVCKNNASITLTFKKICKLCNILDRGKRRERS